MTITVRLMGVGVNEVWALAALEAFDGEKVRSPGGFVDVGTIVGPAWVEEGSIYAQVELFKPLILVVSGSNE